MQATFEPAQVAPGKKGKIIVTFDAPKAMTTGYVYESLILSVNGSKEYSNRLSVTAELSEDFSKLSPKDKANAPIAQFDKKECNFGEIKQGEKTSCDFTLTNAGKSILFIRENESQLWVYCRYPGTKRNSARPIDNHPGHFRLYRQIRTSV